MLTSQTRRIPRLKTAVDQLLAACLAALARLPARPAMDSAAELVQLVFAFCAAVRATVDGTHDDKAFVHRSLAHYRALRAAVRGTAPDFRPFEDPGEYRRPPEPLSQQREDAFSGSVLGGAASSVSCASECASEDGDGDGDGDGGRGSEGEAVAIMGLLDVRRVIKE